MAITARNLTFGSSIVDATSFTSASISPNANELILIAVLTRSSATPTNTPSLSGASLSFNQVATIVAEPGVANPTRTTVFRSLTASPGSGAITIDLGGQSQRCACWCIDGFTGIDTGGTNGADAIVQSNTVNTTVASLTASVTLSAFASASNATYGVIGWTDRTGPIAPGGGFTELAEALADEVGGRTLQTEFKDSNDTLIDWTMFENVDEYGAIGIELKAAAAEKQSFYTTRRRTSGR